MSNPFRMLEAAFDEFNREQLSKEELEAIRKRTEEEEAQEAQDEQADLEEDLEGMAKTMPLMLEKFKSAGVHKHLAKFMFEFFTELKAAGFTDDQAIKIASANFNVGD